MSHRSLIPRTFADSMLGWLSKVAGIAAASSTSRLSTFAQAAAWSLCGATLAFAIAVLICGSLTWPQFSLLVGTIDAPLNGTSRIVSGLLKSRIQPTDGQASISAAGTPQYLAYTTD